MTGKYVLLLRGINVGANNRIAMADLRRALEGVGLESVTTLLQSGNVLFDADSPPDIDTLQAAITAVSGVTPHLLLLKGDRFRDIVEAFPLTTVVTDDSRALITFVHRMPSGSVRRPTDEELAPERLVLGRDAVYQWLPDGVLGTRLPANFARQFGDEATARNLRTAKKIVAALAAP